VGLRIGFDIDGVFADMEGELLRQATIVFGEPLKGRLEQPSHPDVASPEVEAADTPVDTTSARQADPEAAADNAPTVRKVSMSVRQQGRLWRHVASIENFWETLEELEPGVIERLAALALERRWEIIFLTKRPKTAGTTAQLQSQRWLASKGFTLPSVFVAQGSRGRIAAALGLDIVVDDRPENCHDVLIDSKARAILVWREDDQRLPATARRQGIGVVKTVGECLDIISQIDTASREDPGVLGRVKRLLGFKEPANA
jgi:hypothetical protein